MFTRFFVAGAVALCVAPCWGGTIYVNGTTGNDAWNGQDTAQANGGKGSGARMGCAEGARIGRNGLEVALIWSRAVFGWDIGTAGLHVVDLDGDGNNEIIAAAAEYYDEVNTYWYVVGHGAAGYTQRWISAVYPSQLRALQVADADGDGDPDVLVAYGNCLEIRDGPTLAVLSTLNTSASVILTPTVADVDGDGDLEVIFCDYARIYVYNVATGQPEWTSSDCDAWRLAVANVDSDPGLEMVVSGAAGYVLDGQTHTLEWENPAGFGRYVRTGDLDGDGMAEVVAGASWYHITVYDVDLQSTKYEIPVDSDLGAVQVADVEEDGTLEIVYGDGQWGNIYVHAGIDGAFKWSVYNPGWNVTNLAVGDTDGEGVNELLWGVSQAFDNAGYLFIADCGTHQREWNSEAISGPFCGLDYGDVDSDGTSEFLYTAYTIGGDGRPWFVHDATTMALEYASDSTSDCDSATVYRIRHANVDDDPQSEIIVPSTHAYGGRLICYDGLSHTEQWRSAWLDGRVFCGLQIGDVDGDGQFEAVGGLAPAPGTGITLYVINTLDGSEEWHSGNLGSYWAALSLLRLGQVDADPNLEMVVGEYGGALWVYDGVTRVQEAASVDLDLTALELADRDGDGIQEIIAGTASGSLLVVSPTTGGVVETIANYGGQINGLAVCEVNYDNALDYIFGAGDRVYIYDGTAPGSALWVSEPIAENVGANDSLLARDINSDDRLEVVVNMGIGIRIFAIQDCNHNGVPDSVDIVSGTSTDCDGDLLPDECETLVDCNGNGVFDACDIVSGYSTDCDDNGIPDECQALIDCNNNGVFDACDIASGYSSDCDNNGIPDECQTLIDCNNNGVFDACDIASGYSTDCDGNAVPDECPVLVDCNGNGISDTCDLLSGYSADCNNNGLPDECESQADCNANGVLDICDLSSGTSGDCNGNAVPDECDPFVDCNSNGIFDACDIADGVSRDCNTNGVPDECETLADCNGNGVFDACDIADGVSLDCNSNSVPDECDIIFGGVPDCNSNGAPDECDFVSGYSFDCNANGIPDECDLANGTSQDANSNGVPDECEVACIGDLNCDGAIDFGDINPFVVYLFNFSAWQAAYPWCDPRSGDINCDGTFGQWSFGDINPFVQVMTQCGMGCPCPGPVSCP